jgi:hypothetical protein
LQRTFFLSIHPEREATLFLKLIRYPRLAYMDHHSKRRIIMRSIQVIVAAAFLLSSVQAFAHEGACKTYAETCKSDPSVTAATGKKAKWQAMDACVTTAAKADTANGQKCLDEKAKHHHGANNSSGAAAPAPAQTPAQ